MATACPWEARFPLNPAIRDLVSFVAGFTEAAEYRLCACACKPSYCLSSYIKKELTRHTLRLSSSGPSKAAKYRSTGKFIPGL